MDFNKNTMEIYDLIKNNNPGERFTKILFANQGKISIIMYLFNADKDVTSGDLSRLLNVSTARVAVLINKLEKQKLVKRIRNSVDGRITIIQLTPIGYKEATMHMEKSLSCIEDIIDDIGYDELLKYIEISGKIKNVIHKQLFEERGDI